MRGAGGAVVSKLLGFSPEDSRCGFFMLKHGETAFWCHRNMKIVKKSEVDGCKRHAADTAPLEGLSILRCAIYDPVEGLQISKMRFSEMGV